MPEDPSDPSGICSNLDPELLARQVQVALFYPFCVGAPIGSAGLIGKWSPPSMGRPAQRVPVPGANVFIHRSHVSVKFRNMREESPSKGVHLADLFLNQASTVEGANDIVLSGFGGSSKELKFIIDWPGYEPERSMISTVSHDGGPLTRAQLGKNIMMVYGQFFRKVATEKILPSRVGFYNIALHQGEERRPDSLGIQFWQLHLVRFREPVPGDDHWVAEIDIVPA